LNNYTTENPNILTVIQVYVLQLEEAQYSSEFQDTLLQYLPEAGKLRVRDRQNLTSKLQTVAGELLARYSVGRYLSNPDQEMNLVFGEKGKPYIGNLNDVHFNISHSGHYVVCAVAPTEIGIDVERIRKVNLRIAERFFSPSEIHDLMACEEELRMQYFITLWTIKESYLKAIGRGLTQHLNSFTIVKNGESYLLTGNKEAETYGIENQQLDPEYMMSVCAPLPYEPSDIRHVTLKDIIKILPKYG
jgi:4'-phosphopantetheinyl transferase